MLGSEAHSYFSTVLVWETQEGKKNPSTSKKCSDYYPFGLVMPGRSSNSANPNDNYKFTGYELDNEAGLDIYHANARGYDPVLGRFMQIDPMGGTMPAWSPYSYSFNNPLKFIDPTGMVPSTHTDEDGNVVAVYDDDDTSVYSHSGSASEIQAKTDACNASGDTSCGGTHQGGTEYWDEFALHDNFTGELIHNADGSVASGGRIHFGTSWDPVISGLNELAIGLGGRTSASMSTGGQLFDIKASAELSPNGAGTGRLLNGKYASARSAGNYLAGMNGATTSQFGVRLSLTGFMKVAGAVHQGDYRGSSTVVGLILGTQKPSASPPFYGEIPYAGRMITAGYNSGLKNLGWR